VEIHKVLNNTKEEKPKFNMITKKPSRKQVVIFMNSNNIKKIIAKSNVYIFNINRLLREVKSNILADFINFNNKDIVIITNKVATFSDFNIMEKYVKVAL